MCRPSPFSSSEQVAQIAAQLGNLLAKSSIATEPRDAPARLLVEQAAHRLGRFALTGGEDAQRPAVDRQPFDIDNRQAMAAEEVIERGERVVAEVLVIDRIELAVVDHLLDVRRLDHRDAVLLEEDADPLHDAVEVRHMGEHIVRVHDVRALPGRRQPRRDRRVEELRDGRDAALLGDLRDVARRLDAEHGDARLPVILEQIAVVAGDLDGEARAAKAAIGDQPPGERLGVPEHRIGERREVEVIAEEYLRRHRLGDLHERAIGAEDEVQRVQRLRFVKFRLRQQRIGERRPAERENRLEVAAAAGAADRFGRHRGSATAVSRAC